MKRKPPNRIPHDSRIQMQHVCVWVRNRNPSVLGLSFSVWEVTGHVKSTLKASLSCKSVLESPLNKSDDPEIHLLF